MQNSARGTAAASGQATADQKNLYTIREKFAKQNSVDGQRSARAPYKITDVKDPAVLKDQSLSIQQKAEYRSSVNREWQAFIQSTNRDFFDSNKLYLKSMQDYMTREMPVSLRKAYKEAGRSPKKSPKPILKRELLA